MLSVVFFRSVFTASAGGLPCLGAFTFCRVSMVFLSSLLLGLYLTDKAVFCRCCVSEGSSDHDFEIILRSSVSLC